MPLVSGGLGRAIGQAGKESPVGKGKDKERPQRLAPQSVVFGPPPAPPESPEHERPAPLVPKSQTPGGIDGGRDIAGTILMPVPPPPVEMAQVPPPAASPAARPVIPMPDPGDPVAAARRRRAAAQQRGTGTILSDSQYLGG